MDKSEAKKILNETREQIDILDKKILKLICERTLLGKKIAKAKMILGMDIEDPIREKEIENKARKIARKNKINEKKITKIVKILTEMNREEQKK